MKRISSPLFSLKFLRALLPLAVVVLTLSAVSLSQLTSLTRAQDGQKLTTASISESGTPSIVYPATKKGETVDDYFGTKVADPYRWLEGDASSVPEVASWVEEQNQLTFAYLEKIPFRSKMKERLTALFNYPRYSAPTRRGEYFFYTKNDGLQNQSIWYRQKGLDGTPEVLLDPNKFSAEGTTRLGQFSLSKDGKYLGYGVSKGGSDWTDVYVMDVASKEKQADHLEWVKVSGISWQGDGFYYSRYAAPEKGQELTANNEFHKVYYHKVGTPQSADTLVYEDQEKANARRFHQVGTTDDERFALLFISDRGKGKKGNAIFYRDLSKADSKFMPIIPEIGNDSFGVIDNVGDKFLMQTDKGAPNGRIFLFDPAKPSREKLERDYCGKTGTTRWRRDRGRKTYCHLFERRFDPRVRS